MKALAIVVLPVPPLPLRISSCFTVHLLTYDCEQVKEGRAYFWVFPHCNFTLGNEKTKLVAERNPGQDFNIPCAAKVLGQILTGQNLVDDNTAGFLKKLDQLPNQLQIMYTVQSGLSYQDAVIGIFNAFHNYTGTAGRTIDKHRL